MRDAAAAGHSRTVPELADAAARDQMSYLGFLAELIMAECDDRARRRSERRIKAAALPREKSLRAFDFDADPSIAPAIIHTLATKLVNELVEASDNLVLSKTIARYGRVDLL